MIGLQADATALKLISLPANCKNVSASIDIALKTVSQLLTSTVADAVPAVY